MMPNGDQEACCRTESFYKLIEGDLKLFAQENRLRLVDWYHDEPVFTLEAPEERVIGYEGIVRIVQVYITGHGATGGVSIFSVNFSDRWYRRIKSVFVARGELPRDKDRISPWLKCAWAISSAVVYSDLWEIPEWAAKTPKLEPIFSKP